MKSKSSTSLRLPGQYVKSPTKLLEDSDLSRDEKFLWIIIRAHCVGNESCYPGINRLAYFMGLKRRQIQVHLDKLVAHKWLERRLRPGLPSILIPLNPSEPMQPITQVGDNPCSPLHPPCAPDCTPPMQSTAPESYESNQMKESVSPDSKNSAPRKSIKKKSDKTSSPNVKILIDHYCAEYEKTFQYKYTVSGQRDGQIFKDLLKDHPVETLKSCIDLFMADTDPWLNGKRTIPVLRSRINQYVQTVSTPDAPVPAQYRKLQ